MYSDLRNYITSALKKEKEISPFRQQELQELAAIIAEKIHKEETVNLIFICTHNSRRSHLCQIWATVAAHYFNFHDKLNSYSGGTEVTALNPRIISSLKRTGFRIETPKGKNPQHLIYFEEKVLPIQGFSKIFSDPFNPKKDFIAVLNCTEAEEACPIVPGASARISLSYSDPKISDDTPSESSTYDERAMQIASEMLFLFGKVRMILSEK